MFLKVLVHAVNVRHEKCLICVVVVSDLDVEFYIFPPIHIYSQKLTNWLTFQTRFIFYQVKFLSCCSFDITRLLLKLEALQFFHFENIFLFIHPEC